MSASRRNLGLDIVRCAAILLVLVAHALLFFFQRYYLSVRELFFVLGFVGVELFFVLSGFLIGRIIAEDVLTEARWTSLRRFWLRRWFRTLPPYYLVVVILVLVGKPFNWQSLVFLQNFDRSKLAFFPVSWSLSIEEWFYLLVPVVLLLGVRASHERNRGRTFFMIAGIVVALSLGGRAFWVVSRNPLWESVRNQPFLRLDSLMLGVLLAGIAVYRPATYALIASRRKLLLPLGLTGIFFVGGYQVFDLVRTLTLNTSLYARVLLFTFLSISIAMVVVALESSTRINAADAGRLWVRTVQFVSVTSYSAYLIHSLVLEPLIAKSNAIDRLDVAFALAIGGLFLTLAVSGLMYHFFERPVLRLRDRLTRRSSPA